MIYANEYFFELLGVTREYYLENIDEINRRSAIQSDWVKIHHAIDEAVRTGKPSEVVHQVSCQDGHKIWVRRCLYIKKEDDGNYYMISFVDDITEEKKLELEQEQVAERQKLVIDVLNAAVFEWNFDENTFYASDTFQEYAISQESPDRILQNMGSSDMVHPEDLPAVRAFFTESKSGKHHVETEIRAKLKTGGYRWVRMVGIFLYDERDELARAIGILIDIDRDKATAVKMNRLVNSLPGGVAIYKLGGRVEMTYANEGITRLTGRTMADYDKMMTKEDYQNMIHEDDRERVSSEVIQAILNGEDVKVLYRQKRKDGSVIWVQLSASKIGEEDHRPVYYAVYTQPTAETALYRQVVEDSVNSIFIGDIKHRTILYGNRAWRRLENVPEDSMITGRYLFDVITKSRQVFDEEKLNALSPDKFEEFYVNHIDGRYLHFYARTIQWNGLDAYLSYAVDETAEHQGREKLQHMVDDVPGGIGIYELTDKTVRRAYLNEGYYRLLGIPSEDYEKIRQSRMFDNVHQDDLAGLEHRFQSMLHGTEGIDHVFRSRNVNRGYIWLRIIGHVIEQKDGTRLVYCSFVNVNAEKEAEMQYQKEIEDIDHFDTENLVVKARYNLSQNKVEYFVSKTEKFPNVGNKDNYDEALNYFAESMVDKAEKDKVRKLFGRVHLSRACKRGATQQETECAIRIQNQSIAWVAATYKTFLEPHTGEVVCFIYIYDVTQKKRNQFITERLFGVQYELLALAEIKSGSLLLNDFRNKTSRDCSIYSNHMEEEYQQHVVETVSTEDQPELLINLQDLVDKLNQEDNYRFTYCQKEGGEVRRKQLWVSYLDDFHETILVTRSDITEVYAKEQKQIAQLKEAMNEAKQADQAKTSFLSRISHDMRTPLNGIMGLTTLMQEKSDWTEIQSDLIQMKRSGKYLLDLINDTLDMSKIENGRLEMHPVVCDGRIVFNNTFSLMQPNLEAKKIIFLVHTEQLPFRMLYFDVSRVEQVIMNILGNAIKFTPEGGKIDFYMTNLSADQESAMVEFRIKDNGIGMSQEFLPHIFEPFSQEHGETTSQYTGTGLGMAITKQIVELMGGSISVSSVPGDGTEFLFTLCLPKATEEQVKEARERKAKSQNIEKLAGHRVLLFEDHPLNAQIATRLLEKQGVTTECAENGQIGMEMFQEKEPGYYDAILMDIRMPVLDGMETTRRIRLLPRADALTVPIIAMSANAFEEDVDLAFQSGMNDHIAKPVDPSKLYQTLLRWVED